jgi:hypothetical protein
MSELSQAQDSREPQAEPWWATEHTLAELGLDSLQIVRLLEWFAWKMWIAREEGSGAPEYYGKSYDPLAIEISSDGSGVAHSYTFNLNTGGRHHPFESLGELEGLLAKELVGIVEWAIQRGGEDMREALARHFWLIDHPGQQKQWDSYGDELAWEKRKPYYERVDDVVASARPKGAA